MRTDARRESAIRADARHEPVASRLTRAWMRFWFAPGSAARLGFSRLVAVGLLFFLFDPRGWSAWAGMDEVLWLPTPLFAVLGLRPFSATALAALAMACKVALLFSAVGFLTRTSAAVAAVSTFYLLGTPHNFGKVFYNDAIVPLLLTILAAARSGDRWSVDCVLRRMRGGTTEPRGGDLAEYRWPIRLVWLLTVTVFFAAGVAKLRAGGLAWIFSDQLSDVLVGQHYSPSPPATMIGLTLAKHESACKILAAAVVALETLSPLALVSARARAIVVPGLVAFTLSLPVLFGFQFNEHFALFAFWVPWNRLGTAILRAAPKYASGSAAPECCTRPNPSPASLRSATRP